MELISVTCRRHEQKLRQITLCELLPAKFRCRRILSCFVCVNIEGIEIGQRQLEELVFVSPMCLTLCNLRPLGWWRWRVGDLGDQICRGRFANSIYQNAQQRDLEKDEKANTKSEEHSFAIAKPGFLLLWGISDTGKIRLQL